MAAATERPYSNNGLLIGTGAAAPPRSMRALLTGEVPVGITGYPPVPVRVAFPVTAWGAVGDGTTDDTTAINGAIAAASAAGGGVVTFPPGTYMASQIVLYRNVILDGGSPAAVCLKQIAATNTDFVISENFASLTGTSAYHPNNAAVPYYFGLKDLRVDVSGQTAGTPRGVAWFGNAQIMAGVVIVENARGHNIYTEASSSAALDPFTAQEEGWFETVISRRAGGKGWHFRGPHNSRIKNYLCINGVNGDWAFHNETTATASGVTDLVDQMHAYTDTATNRKGFLFATGVTVAALHCDGTSLEVNAPGAGVTLHSVFAFQHGASGAPNLLLITSDTVHIHELLCVILSTGGFTCLTWAGANGYLGSAFVFDGVNAATTIGIDITGRAGIFGNLHCSSFSGAGSIGLRNSGDFNAISGLIESCKTAWHNTGASNVRADLEIFTAAGQAAVGGNTPGISDRIDIRETGVKSAATYSQVTSVNAINLNSTIQQQIVLPHQCLYTPAARNVQLSFTAPAGALPFAWDYPPLLVAADATNLDIRCKVGTAIGSAIFGDVVASIRMGA